MLIIGGLFYSLCFVIWLFSSSFWLFLLGFFFLTICGTFVSGTLQAYVYDFLRLNRQEEEFEKIWGRGNTLRYVGIAIAMSLGGFLSTYSYELVVGISALSPLVVVCTSLLLPQVTPASSTKERHYFSFIKQGFKQTFVHPIILRAFFYSAVVAVVPGLLEEYDQVLLSSWLDLPNSFIGVWLAVGIGAGGIGAFYAHRVKNISWWVLNIMALLSGLILIIVPFFNSLWILVSLFLLNTMHGSANVLIQGIIQREIDTDERATITSINSTGMEVSAILLGLAFAFIADAFGIQIGYGFCGLILVIYLMGYFVVRKISVSKKVEKRS